MQISKAINEAVIRRLAGPQSYQRGLDYFTHGHVQSLEEHDETVLAIVRGQQDYSVELSAEEGVLDYTCDCPIGSDGTFCKHCVASALACLDLAGQPKPKRGKSKEITLAKAEKLLHAQDKNTLVRMIVDWAKEDRKFRERLILYAARRSGPDAGAAAVAQAFDKAVRVRDFMSYREATAWARGVNRAIALIEQVLNDGQAAAAIELCESALRSLQGAIESIDDSDGHFEDLRDRLETIHYQACMEARPDPAKLAERLFQWEMHGDFDVFAGAVERYAEILGAKGMKAYRELAEAEWEKVPVRTTAIRRAFGSDSHFRITAIMESFARASGDTEQLVAVMSRDLSSAYGYLRIAEVYHQAGQRDDALLWAEKGLRAFPDRADVRLCEFAAEEYHRRKRHDDAMKLIWAEFLEGPRLDRYQRLEDHAKKAGAWPEWRARALAEIRSRIAKKQEKARGQVRSHWSSPADGHSLLVEIFLQEKDEDEAWREARAGGCSEPLWLRLATARDKTHPDDAAPVYWKLAETAVARVGNGRYEESVALLVKAAAAMKRTGRSAEFIRRLEAMRTTYKNKRNLMSLLEQKRKLLY